MPSGLSEIDRETVKRTVPKAANKIRAGAAARLYVAYPNKQQWVYTGLQGAAVLANDLVGNTYWIKMVDISGSNRGVIWDQEIYDPFYYNQDRTFFHSFELEDCLAGLSFVDEKEARQFKKKMDEREKNASKETKATPFHGAGGQPAGHGQANGKSHSLFGSLGSLLHGGQRSSSAPHVAPPQALSIPPPREPSALSQVSPTRNRASTLDAVDPSWRGILGELLEMGITEDFINQNSDFIKNYIEQRTASGDLPGDTSDRPSVGIDNDRRGKAPPPPPPEGPPGRLKSISPQHTGSTVSSRRGPAPAPPPPRGKRPDSQSTASYQQPDSPPRSPERTPSPPRPAYQFRAPPPIADAGKFAHVPAPSLPKRQRATSNIANPGPPPPPRPPKTPMEEDNEAKPRFGVPPPFQGERTSSAAPPPPPSRGSMPNSSPHTSREPSHANAVQPTAAVPPPLPPKTANALPPLPGHRNTSDSPSPPPLPILPRPVPSAAAASSGPLPPPPLPSSGTPPPPPLPSSGTPPPPPMPSRGGGPPPPPLPPGGGAANAPPLSKSIGGKEDMLASIRASGGIGGGQLKKVSDQEKRDRSATTVPGAAAPAAPVGGAPSSGGSLSDALAAALSQRNKKVSASGM